MFRAEKHMIRHAKVTGSLQRRLKEQISGLEDKSIETTKTEGQREKG